MVEKVPVAETSLFDEAPDEAEVIAVHSKSFAFASRLLPKKVRNDVCKLYAWCRWCDNAVDEAEEWELAKLRLDALRSDVEAIYDHRPVSVAASHWLSELVFKYNIPKELPLDLLKGMESDLEHIPVKNEEEMELYCYQVAGVVGLMMCRILGVSRTHAYENANRLGIAMQMTNIARDIAEDWRRGRCYLPQTWIQLRPGADRQPPSNEQLRPFVERLLKLADRSYEIGCRGYAALPSATRLSIRVAAAVYRDIGMRIRRADCNVMQTRHFVPIHRKMAIFCGELITTCIECISNSIRKKMDFDFRSLKTVDAIFHTEIVSGDLKMKSEFQYLAVFGLSMTLIMATVLFALMGMNPKLSSYETMPWIYSGCSAIGATALWFWAKLIGRTLNTVEN